jgi:hypothetical protein
MKQMFSKLRTGVTWMTASDGAREVLLTGSLPRKPAAEVFRLVQAHLGQHVRRMPDGEQAGWLGAVGESFAQNPALEAGEAVPFTDADTWFGSGTLQMYRLRAGTSVDEFELGLVGIAEAAADSYRQFKELKAEGVVGAATRFQATAVGPWTAACVLDVPADVALPRVEGVLNQEIAGVVAAIPTEELTVQFDLPVELEVEECRRNPGGFVAWFIDKFEENWSGVSMSEMVASVARVADSVPEAAELGFHLCSMWHIDPRGGQDLQVHVDWANALAERVSRRIDYIHMPVIPDLGPEDFAKLAGLRLAAETKLFLGLIHTRDGIEGTRRRINDARKVVPDFGVAHFCGLNPVFFVDPDKLDEALDLHREAAEV